MSALQTPRRRFLAAPARLARTLAAAALLWGVLAGGAGWGFAVLPVAAAVLAWLSFAPSRRGGFSPVGFALFLFYFLVQSLAAGADVARRALRPGLILQPAWIEYALRLPPGPGRVLFVCTVSLLPGTVSAHLGDEALTVHSLTGDATRDLARLERRIARMLDLPLDGAPCARIRHA
ncbi:MAG: Na+/H+ antiporter subunit E [Pseudomonadota bacterium]|nr:Na+/H+ antiporter subunit E [Pseudomonadota bacterium]